MLSDPEFLELVTQLQRIRVIDFRELKHRAKALRKNKPRKEKPDYKQVDQNMSFDSVLDVIYLVRYNLVHGSKNIAIPLEQSLVNICYNILLKIYEDDVF